MYAAAYLLSDPLTHSAHTVQLGPGERAEEEEQAGAGAEGEGKSRGLPLWAFICLAHCANSSATTKLQTHIERP